MSVGEKHAPDGGKLATLDTPDGLLTSALAGSERRILEQETLPDFLPRQRWFGAKDSAIKGVTVLPLGELDPGAHALAVADVALASDTQRYLLPLSAAWGEDAAVRATRFMPVLANIVSGERKGVLIDSAADPALALALLKAVQETKRLEAGAGFVSFEGTDALRQMQELGTPRALGAEQSNVSIAFGTKVIFKLYRRLRAGEQPDVELARFLTRVAHFANTPEFLGEIVFRPNAGEATTLAAAFGFVPNRGDAWSVVTETLHRDLENWARGSGPAALVQSTSSFASELSVGELLGRRTAELHKALAVPTDDAAFAVDPLTPADVLVWSSEAIVEAESLLDRLRQDLAALSPEPRTLAENVLARRNALIERLGAAARMTPSGGRSRIHGDYHLGQVLVTEDDFIIIDFEGEPKRSLKERRAKSSPLRDVAGMLRSFDYAAWTAVNRANVLTGATDVASRAESWRRQVGADFIRGYEAHVGGAASYPEDKAFAKALTEMFLLQKAIYEVSYELANRPDWVVIPLSGVRNLLDEG